MSRKLTPVISGDWVTVENNFNIISRELSEVSSPIFSGLTLSGLTSNRLLKTDSDIELKSVSDLTNWVAGTTNQISVSDDGDGTVTLAITNPLDIPGKLTAGSFSSPIDVTDVREYGFEIHYSGNNYNATGIRSRASAVTTDTSTQIQGGLFQAANNDGINVGVLNGLIAEAIGKSDSTAATISMMRAGIFNAEWNSKDTVTDLRTLHVRIHTRNNATEGYISNSGYGIYIENEAVGGNGQALNAGIYFKATNLSGGNKAFDYGIDFSGGTYNTAEIKLSSGDTIENLTIGQLNINSDLVVFSGEVEATTFTIEETTLSIDEWTYLDGLDQALKTSDSPTHPTITLTDIDDGRIPYSSAGTLVDTSLLTWTPATSTFGTGSIDMTGSLKLGTNAIITLPRASNYGYILQHSGGATSNGARGSFYPQNDDSGMVFYIIPKGTSGWNTQTGLALWNTDFINDSSNWERLYLTASKSYYSIEIAKAGTGTNLYPLYFQMGGNNALVIDTNADVDIPNDLTAGTIQADNGYTGSWVNAEANTVTVVGGIITDVS